MAYKTFDSSIEGSEFTTFSSQKEIKIEIQDGKASLPDASFVKDSTITRDGNDLVLETNESKAIIENYYSSAEAPTLEAPDGSALTPKLVKSFSADPLRFANADSAMSDESAIGIVNELSGEATITRVDGTTESLRIGSPIHQGDIIETATNGAANIIFTDESSFAVSENSRLTVDEYVFDPSTNAGETNFSVLKGMFVYTSGLIGREDPDDVQIDTPVGSIGIRGTIIAGDVDQGQITVVEGAIVLNDFNGNEVTLANQFETAKFGSNGNGIENIGQLPANDVAGRFSGVSKVAPDLFSSINDSAKENADGQAGQGEQNTRNTEGAENAEQKAEDQQQAQEEQGTKEGEQADSSPEKNNEEQNAKDEDKNADDEPKAQDDSDSETAEGGEEGGDDGQKPQEEQAGDNAAQAEQGDISPQDVIGQNAGQDLGQAALDSSLNLDAGRAAKAKAQQKARAEQKTNQDDQTNTNNNGRPPEKEDTGTDTIVRPFSLDITPVSVEENSPYARVAVVQGVNGTITNLTLGTVENNFLEAIETTPGSGIWDISLRSGETFDFEDILPDINFTTTIVAEDGTTSISDNFTPIVSNVDEGMNHFYHQATGKTVTTEGQTVSYDFKKDFTDEDNSLDPLADPINFSLGPIEVKIDLNNDGDFSDTLNIGAGLSEDLVGVDIDGNGTLSTTVMAMNETFTISDLSHLESYLDAGGASFNNATGLLEINFSDGSSFPKNIFLSFDVTATDAVSGGTDRALTRSYEVKSFDITVDDSSEAAAVTHTHSTDFETFAGSVYNDTYTLQAAASSNNIFSGDGADQITVNGSYNFVNAGQGADILALDSATSQNNEVRGGGGDDYFVISGNARNNLINGGAGQDIFAIENLGVNNTFIGGEGDDTFIFDIGPSSPTFNDPLAGLQGNAFNKVFEGNGGYNVVKLEGGSSNFLGLDSTNQNKHTLDFTHANISNGGATSFHNISEINLEDVGQYKVKLKASDVFEITDENNVLIIDGTDTANKDILDFNNDSGKAFTLEDSSYDIGGDIYNVYSNGDVTLIVDHDINVATAIT